MVHTFYFFYNVYYIMMDLNIFTGATSKIYK